MSDTPLTDKAQCTFGGTSSDVPLDAVYRDCLEFTRNLERQLAEAKAEIEAMRPVVSMFGEIANAHPKENWRRCLCAVCITWRNYESRKKP